MVFYATYSKRGDFFLVNLKVYSASFECIEKVGRTYFSHKDIKSSSELLSKEMC